MILISKFHISIQPCQLGGGVTHATFVHALKPVGVQKQELQSSFQCVSGTQSSALQSEIIKNIFFTSYKTYLFY